jgi:adenine-specific DNA-methyltransferase
MMLTDYHAKYYAYELTRRCPSDSVEKFTAALMDSQVDLKPHQVDAALFAFRSPFSKGAILADEVGLGKTIEAGIVLSQKWAERKRKILIIAPSSLRMQWGQELADKFYLPSTVLDSKLFKQAIKAGSLNPFESAEIVICSYYFARNKSAEVASVNWDLAVIDEAHRLRNVYKPGNMIANDLKKCLAHAPKLLLTATPLQNSLMELYGLVSFIDEYAFGDQKSFGSQFARITSGNVYNDLRDRLKPICKRTLRRQVLEYINYTARIAHTQHFEPTPDEEVLYEMVSEYLRREDMHALPKGQRNLMVLVMRKLLASSTFAIAGALLSLANRLKDLLNKDVSSSSSGDPGLVGEFETLPEVADEWGIDPDQSDERLSEEDRTAISQEIVELESFYELAVGIRDNAKGTALLDGLRVGFEMTETNGGKPKALVFTESRRTQNYLAELLAENGYDGKVVLFNGSNTDEKSRAIHRAWKLRHEGSDRASGVRAADTRAALVDYFRDEAQIMIATEAAAEGINLQFCSMVVNYDLPWNPQRIEQRIGRCHRYGQKHDVVVVNFLNTKNAADQRVYELLSEKFQLFSGVFGVSDEVLGSIESGVDFEKRIIEIYQTCRHPDEIKASFDALQSEMSETIDGTMRDTRTKLLENFDAEVAEKLNVYDKESQEYLNKYESFLWNLTRHELANGAKFDEEQLGFTHSSGRYFLKSKQARCDKNAHHYRLQHPLALEIVRNAKGRALPAASIRFDYCGSGKNIAILEPLVGQQGLLVVQTLSVQALEAEDYLLFAGITEDGQVLDQDQCRRLFDLPGAVAEFTTSVVDTKPLLEQRKQDVLVEVSARNAAFFDEEMEKLDKWADDVKKGLEIHLKHLDVEIKTLKAEARKIADLQRKVAAQRKVKELEKKRSKLRRNLYDEQDLIDQRKETLLETIEAKMSQSVVEEEVMRVGWEVV